MYGSKHSGVFESIRLSSYQLGFDAELDNGRKRGDHLNLHLNMSSVTPTGPICARMSTMGQGVSLYYCAMFQITKISIG